MNMHSKRILVMKSKWLAGGVIESLLSAKAHYEVIEILPRNCEELGAALRTNEADVLVVDELNLSCKQTDIFDLFCDLPDFRLVVVSVRDNRVAVMQRQAVQINQLADFFAIL